MCWAFDYPICCFLLFEAASVTDPTGFAIVLLHFTPLIFAGSYAENFIATEPQRCFAAARWAITMRFHRLCEPNPILETKSAIGEGANWANIDNISDKIVL